MAAIGGASDVAVRESSAIAPATADPQPLAARLELLGGFALTSDGRPVDLPTNAQRVVASLALRRRVATRTAVASMLWLDSPDERARANLRTALWRIKHTCDVVVVRGASLALRPDVEVDVHDIVEHVHHILDGVDRPWRRGDLEGFTAELLPEWDDDWLFFERERLRQLRLHALERVCAELSAAKRHGEAIEAALAAVDVEPLRETARRALIAAHLAEGNRDEALRAADAYRVALDDALGITPSAELDALVPFRPS